MNDKDIVIFTDLDGTLLDHENYSFENAIPALDFLKKSGIPIIPVTSKTAAELQVLRSRLDLDTPFIIENGAGVYIPEQYYPNLPEETATKDGFVVYGFSEKRTFWISMLEELKCEFIDQFSHFSELGDEKISELTGLSIEEARLANNREFSEPIYWYSNAENFIDFSKAVEKKGFRVVKGGRFSHIVDSMDKGETVRWLIALINQSAPTGCIYSVALGDGENDVAMLKVVDQAVVIKSPVNPELAFKSDKPIFYTRKTGPGGWNEAIFELLVNK